jgi:formate C-acetyltransferase
MKPVKAVGFATAVDSLSAIKKFVYDEKKLTLRQLKKILDVNFEGYPNERAMLSHNAPCFGNDNPEADGIAREIFQCFCNCVHDVNKQGIFGYACVSLFSFIGQITVGEVVGATANGRLRGEALSDSMGASQGKDMSGPTRLIKSVLHLDNINHVTGAYVLNIKLNPATVRGEKGLQNLITILKAYIKNNGVQVQFNFIDNETLKAAKRDPDKHQNLVVRVAGYCEYFNNLDAHMQDEIISRTAHDF